MKRIGLLTGGGDAPGLNAVISGVIRQGIRSGLEVYGIKRGWAGIMEDDMELVDLVFAEGLITKGGTSLKSSRTNPYNIEGGPARVREIMGKRKLDALIAIGGDDTLGVANKLAKEGLPVIGVPKTIDNDLAATEATIGFDTSINIVMDTLGKLRTTAESHERTLVLEVMGRYAGWIAIMGGIAGDASIILIPEKPYDINTVCDLVKSRYEKGLNYALVVIAEGAEQQMTGTDYTEEEKDAFGHKRLGGVGKALAKEIEKRTGFETRSVKLGHIQRGGPPSAFDRVLGARLGVAAVDLVLEKGWGQMVSYQDGKIIHTTLQDAVGQMKTVDDDLYRVAEAFFS